MDVYINNFLITSQNRGNSSKTELIDKDSQQSNSNESPSLPSAECINHTKPLIMIDDQIKSDNVLIFDEELTKKSPTSKASQILANSSFGMRKKIQNQSEDIIQSANFNRNFGSSRGQQDSRNEKTNLNVYNNTFLGSKQPNSSQNEKDFLSRDGSSICGVDEYNDSLDDGDDLSYFQLNYISQTATDQQIKKVRRVKRNYLDKLPEANPIAKREYQGIEPLKSIYEYPLKLKDQVLADQYLDMFLLATEKPEEFQALLQRKEPLAQRNISAINANYFSGANNPGISVNQDGSVQTRQFIYQIFTEDNNIVYLRNPLLTNSVLCTLYKMTALRNGEPYSDFKAKEAAELNQQERLESLIKENMTKLPKVLQFESKFESGNLSIAAMKSTDEYNLLLQNDINTKGYTQWFFFSVKKTLRNQTVKFNVINFYKNGSLFNEGMKISIFSKKKYDLTQTGWFKGAFDIGYIKNNIVKQNDNYYYTLTFKYTFEYNDDEVFFAYNIPYTYSQLNQFLHKCETDTYKNQFIYKKTLCRTLIGNKVDLITITNPCKNTQDEMSKRKGVIISARVHPGETVSSYIMEGLIEYLLQNTKESHFLREKFIFKIIPMLNPDGVIHGNYRCSLAGCDLNRRWKNPNQTLHPEIYFTKQMIFDFKQKNEIAMVIDLHGHSRKMNVFAYGCHDKKKPYECREFPFLLSKINQSFSFKDCNFKVQKNREGTARIALYKSLGISNIFTVESSFCGPSYINSHFTAEHLKDLGHSICQSILMKFEMQNFLQYINQQGQSDDQQQNQTGEDKRENDGQNIPRPKSSLMSYIQNISNQSTFQSNKVFLDELYENPDNLEIGMKNDSGSDSEPSGDNMSDDELKKIFTSKTKKSKKQLDKNTKDLTSLQAPNPKDSMSQTQTVFKKKTQSNFMTKSPEKKINIPPSGASNTEVKQRTFNFDKAPSPVRSRTVIKNTFHQSGYNFVKDQKNLKEKDPQATTKTMTVLEPKFVYFPLKVPDAFPNIDKFKSSLRETKLRKLRENSQIKQQMGNPQQIHRVMQMKLKQNYNNNNNNGENQNKIDKKQLISPREFKFNSAIPQPIDNPQLEYGTQAYTGVRDTSSTNKSQLGRILRTIMNTQNQDWVYGYQGGNSQYESLNKSFVQEGSITLQRRPSKQIKQGYYQPPSTANPVEKSQRSKSNDISQYVFKMQKYDIFNGTFTNLPESKDITKQSNRSLHENQFYQPTTLSDQKTLQKGRFDTALVGSAPPQSNSASNNLSNSIANTTNTNLMKQKIVKPQSAPRTLRKSLAAYNQLDNGFNIFSGQENKRFEQDYCWLNGSNTVDLVEKQQCQFQPIKIVYI